jgi:V8-like Glu-specific endopeptidase
MKTLLKTLLVTTLLTSVAGASPVKIIGKDDRKLITNKNAKLVHDSIGLMVIRKGNIQGYCTGTVIGPRHVITAAHCLWDDSKSSTVPLVTFIPGNRDDHKKRKFPFGTFRSSKLRVLSEYKKNRSTQGDLGLITFSQNLPVDALSMGVLPLGSTSSLTIAGYPIDKTLGQLWEGKGKRISHFLENDSSAHDVDTVHGQSGSAVRAIINGKETIIAIHSKGKSGLFYDYNEALFLTNKSITTIKKWMKEDL